MVETQGRRNASCETTAEPDFDEAVQKTRDEQVWKEVEKRVQDAPSVGVRVEAEQDDGLMDLEQLDAAVDRRVDVEL